MDRFFNFKWIEVVHIGTKSARITAVTRQRVNYVDEVGNNLSIDLEECARMFLCLESSGLFPPTDDTDWGRLADAMREFSAFKIPNICCIGLRGVIDEPPWFQFLNRRRTQFEFEDAQTMDSELLGPLSGAGWQTFDAC